MTNPRLTTASGIPVADNQNSLSAGPRGPLLLQDFHLIEKLQHFNRERIPERQPHAKGGGAFGTFVVTGDVSAYTKAAFLQEHRIAEWQMRRWVAALADGDLDGNVIPRQTGEMTREDAAEVRRLNARIAKLETELDSERKVVDALGKAISVMHDLGVADDAEDQDGTRKNKPGTSS